MYRLVAAQDQPRLSEITVAAPPMETFCYDFRTTRSG
jgi:hypothetical protein